MTLSPHFTVEEFTFSETAVRLGLEVQPSASQLANATRLCETVLEPIRSQLGRALMITSGIRPQWLNDRIGGAKNSAHLTGCAADVRIDGMAPEVFARWIRNRGFVVDQVIEEFG